MINCFVLLQIKAWIKIELYYYVHNYFLCLLLFNHSSSNNIDLKFNGCGIKFSSCMKVLHMVVLKLKRMFTIIFSLVFCIFCTLMFQILEVVFLNFVVTIFNLDLNFVAIIFNLDLCSIEMIHSLWPWFHCFCSWRQWLRRKYLCIFFWSQCFQVQLALLEVILLMIEWKHPTSWWKDSWLLFEKSSMLITFTQTCTFPSFATWFFVT